MKTRRKAKKDEKQISDDEVMFWFGNHLMSYFGDDEHDDEIIETLRELFPDYPFVENNFRRGLKIAIEFSDKDRMRLVQEFANRRAETGEEALAWLKNLQNKLFTF